MNSLLELKAKISEVLINKVNGVVGVGLPSQGITIYLEADTPEIRARVATAIENLKVSVPICWEVTGTFNT